MPEWSVPRLSSAVEQIIPSEVRPYVLRVAIVKSPGSTVPGSATDDQVADSEIGCTANDVARLAFADVDLHRPDGLLELGEFLDLDDAADGQRPGDGPDGNDLLDLVADPDQRLLQLVG